MTPYAGALTLSVLRRIITFMVHIKFYYKGGCWLCDTALETLNGLSGKYDIEMERIDIDTDPALYDLYRFDIPVLEFADGSTLNGHIKKKALLEKLQENKTEAHRQP